MKTSQILINFIVFFVLLTSCAYHHSMKLKKKAANNGVLAGAALGGLIGLSGNQSENIPLSQNIKPLPHNALFNRRNNCFGTKITSGIKELIENGVMIEQRKIRFDDFVAMNIEGIPLPATNHALAVSHGIVAIPLQQRRYDKATHYFEIALKTADAAPLGHPQNKPPAVNYIFVTDVSGSMSGEKLEKVKRSIRKLFKNLRKDDVIGIVAFDDRVKTLFKAKVVKDITAREFGKIINNLSPGGGTDINLGLSYGINEISRYDDGERLNQIFLFSDGNPTSGETDWMNIHQNIAAKTRGNINISTFAYGSDSNRRELDKLAGLTGGKSDFIIEPKDILHSLKQELNRREKVAAINIQMQIEIDPDITIWHLYGHDQITDSVNRAAIMRQVEKSKAEIKQDYGIDAQADIVTKEKGIRIFVPNLAVGETYWVALELEVPENKLTSGFGNATVQYLDTFVRENEKYQFQLTPKGKIEPELVVHHALGLWTSEEVFYALDDIYAQDLATAEKRIKNHISMLESAETTLASQNYRASHGLLASVKLKDDIITLNNFLALAQNLGKTASYSDTSSGTRSYFVHWLNQFGSMRSGFRMVNYPMSFSPGRH
ncbi:MAG: VWA domain-containing protein [Desulfobacterales bacterium]|nr:VWA domain-containing protein [Desulfobacterales bacterium]